MKNLRPNLKTPAFFFFFYFVGILLISPILSQCKNIKIGATVKLRRQIHLFIFSQGEAASGSYAKKPQKTPRKI